MHVAVIGAGPAGLVTIKELLEEGHTVTCFERTGDLGGVFRFHERDGGVFESTRLTSSTFITCFSDFPPPRNAPLHFKHTEYLGYLQHYAEHFTLLPRIRFHHDVEQVERAANGLWTLRVRDLSAQTVQTYTVDAVAVCSGTHQKPVMSQIPNQAAFTGVIMHSNSYKRPAPFHGKRVLVVGGGESGSDIVEEVATVATACALSLRRGVLVIPRLILGLPNDYYTERLFYTLPPWVFRTKPPGSNVPRAVLLIMSQPVLIIPVVLLVSGVARLTAGFKMVEWICLVGTWLLLFFIFAQIVKFLTSVATPKDMRLIMQFIARSGADHGEQFATKTLGAVKAIARGRCALKPPIREFTKDGVRFVDGSTYDADAVIFCTGFVPSCVFLGRQTIDVRTLYKNCFDVKLGSTVCFVGFARPAIGAIPPIAEMQARWFAHLLSGHSTLPPAEVMREEIKKDAALHREMFRVVTDRLSGLVDYTSYMDQLAEFIGCKPTLKELWREPKLLFRVHFCPFSGHQYRLRGPHSKKAIAKTVLYRLRIGPIRRLEGYGILCFVVTAACLYRLGFRQFKPSLRL